MNVELLSCCLRLLVNVLVERPPTPALFMITSFLPPLIRISSQSAREIPKAIHKLKPLYLPPKPPHPAPVSLFAKRIHDTSVPDSGYAENGEELDDVILRSFCLSSPEGPVVVEPNDVPLLDQGLPS